MKMLINDELEKIQQFIKENGYADSKYAKLIKNANLAEANKKLEWYKSKEGKAYKRSQNDTIEYLKINWANLIHWNGLVYDVLVDTDQATVFRSKSYFSIEIEKNASLTDTDIESYAEFKEIPLEQYEREFQIWNEQYQKNTELFEELIVN